jgi:YD repeat-containing protein
VLLTLFEDGSCGLVALVTPDGGSQVFQWDNGLVSFTPQKGYHTRLERDGCVYRFVDKSGNVHHFESPDPEGRPRLDFIEEAHGGRLRQQSDTMGRQTSQDWDGLDRLVKSVRVAGGGSEDPRVQSK